MTFLKSNILFLSNIYEKVFFSISKDLADLDENRFTIIVKNHGKAVLCKYCVIKIETSNFVTLIMTKMTNFTDNEKFN